VAASPTALITGISGQDGSFLAELLLGKGYEVVGLVRGRGEGALGCSSHLRERLRTLEGDLLAPETLRAAIEETAPSELYHLAAPSFVPASWERPGETLQAIVASGAAVLEAVRDRLPECRVLIAGSGAMFGDAPESPQREDTPAFPVDPYAIAKHAVHRLVGAMRDHNGLHASSAIFYNHESERRPEHFVTRRISRAAAAISLGLESELTLGSLDAVRDWSFAGDFMEAAWLMVQQDAGEDYVLASGVGRTVAELARTAFAVVGLELSEHLRVDDTLKRPLESTPRVGDPAKARARLGWEPSLSFEELVARMVNADLERLATEVRA
jgi:GDPmannose 4,6-dehydratase